jgi:hypothetical protein
MQQVTIHYTIPVYIVYPLSIRSFHFNFDITVRAYDIFDVHAEDVVTVYKDTSQPEVENLWLSSGDLVNISVHSIEDFSQMT